MLLRAAHQAQRVVCRMLNVDGEAVHAASVSQEALARSRTMRQQAEAYAAAVRRGEKRLELNRQLSAFTSGDFSRREFNTLFASQLGDVIISARRWTEAGRHRKAWGAGAVPEAQAPFQRHRMHEARLQKALAFISDPRNLQQLAFGDRRLKIEGEEDIIVGDALLKQVIIAGA